MTRTLAVLLALGLAPLAAFAESHGGATPGGHFVESWDLNSDGKVTLDEATERRGDVFYTFDYDEDGILSPEEHDQFDAARAQDMADNGEGMGKGKRNPANGMLRKVTDANGDGQVTRDEFLGAVPAWFAAMDRNGDGAVTTDDVGPTAHWAATARTMGAGRIGAPSPPRSVFDFRAGTRAALPRARLMSDSQGQFHECNDLKHDA